jgi:hypothetical protein
MAHLTKLTLEDLFRNSFDEDVSEGIIIKVKDIATSGTDNNRILEENVPCLAGVVVGDAVKIVSGTAEKAIGTSLVNANVLGIVVNKPTATLCDIQFAGLTPISVFSGSLTANGEYFLSESTAGLLTLTPPGTGGGYVLISLGVAFDADRLRISIGSRTQRA